MSCTFRRSTPFLPWPRTAPDGTAIGIDLARLHGDIRRLVIAKVSPPDGLSHADFLQEVFLLLATRNHQPSAFDPRKGGFPNYVIRTAQTCREHLYRGIGREMRQAPAPEVIRAIVYAPHDSDDPSEAMADAIASRDDLSDEEQQVLTLRLVERMSWREIATTLMRERNVDPTNGGVIRETNRLSALFRELTARLSATTNLSTDKGIILRGASEGVMHRMPAKGCGGASSSLAVDQKPVRDDRRGGSLAPNPLPVHADARDKNGDGKRGNHRRQTHTRLVRVTRALATLYS